MSATASNGSLKRREMDVTKLMMCDYSLALVNDSVSKFHVSFRGPVHSPYANGLWRVKVELPEEYPYKSPSIGFVNKIYLPNVCPTNGAVCLDVINQTWSPMYDLVNVFEIFLPQLLLYPNPSDPLNGEAAGLLLKDPLAYEQKVKEMVAKHASAFAVATLMTKHDSSLEGQREAADQNDDLGAEAYVSSDEENEDPRRETNAKRAR